MEIRQSPFWWRRILLRAFAYLVWIDKQLFRRSSGDISRPNRIGLFVSIELLGGGVIVSAMVKALKTLYPTAIIYVVGEQERSGRLESFFKSHSWVDGLILCPRRGKSTFSQWIEFYRRLKTYRLDLCVLSPNHSCSDSVFLYLCGIPQLIGAYLPASWTRHDNIENRFLTQRLTEQEIGREPYQLLNFPEAYGRVFMNRRDFRISELVPYLRYQPEDLPGLKTGPLQVVLHPGGPPFRRWPWENFAEVGKKLVRKYDATLFLIGGKDERDIAERVLESIRGTDAEARVYNCCGSTMNQTINYVASAKAYLGNNAGPVQIAVALGTPVVGIFPEGDRRFSGPDAAGLEHCVVSGEVVKDISIEAVWEALEPRLQTEVYAGK